jgi:quinol-cytochrome oxidoreductase complex cytochrome b subunit
MSEEPLQQPEPAPVALPLTVAEKTTGPSWFHRLSSVLFIIFCFELGLFLLIYPWTDAWTENSLSVFAPAAVVPDWRLLWNNSYFRGAISGIGIANIWIALTEVFRMFSRRTDA